MIIIAASSIPGLCLCIWTLGSVWDCASPAIHSCMVYCNIAGHIQIMGSSYVPCIYRLWYCAFPCNRAEKRAWNTWQLCDNHTESFHPVTVAPNNIISQISTIKHSHLLLWNRSSSMLSSLVDKGRGVKHTNNKGWPYGPRQTMCISECVACGITLQLAPELLSPSNEILA